jgi:hypothetical protein
MSKNISSDSLFHFIDKFKYLNDILDTQALYPRFCREELKPFFSTPVYIPMKCFCDIPLSLIAEHASMYGKYGIAFSKEWGENKGLQPVTYYNPDSLITKSIASLHNTNLENYEIDIFDDENLNSFRKTGIIHNNLRTILCNHKPIKGKMVRNNKVKEKIFYNEREWRFLGSFYTENKEQVWIPVMQDDEYFNKIRNDMQAKIEEYSKLEFAVDDIRFIIVKTTNEIVKLSKVIDQMNCSFREKCILKTKLITYNDIDMNV